MARGEHLGLSPHLAAHLQAWQHVWEGWQDQPPGRISEGEVRTWCAEGQTLAERVAAETGAEVVYRWPIGLDGGDPHCEHCGSIVRSKDATKSGSRDA
jgi:hypothetical protein